jgi:hypothetical protein
MLTCYTGVMGAGKTYRMVSFIKDNFSKNGLVLTNINGIQESETIKHFDFVLHDFKHFDPNPDSFNQSSSPFENMVMKIREDYHLSDDQIIYFCIDEAQNFYKATKDNDVFYSVEKCRHYGVEFHITCQDIKALPKRIYELCEVEQRAIPSRYCIPGLFGYKKMVNKQMTGTSWMLKKKSVFGFYKSQMYGKPKKSVNWLFIGVFAVLAYGGYFMYDLMTGGIWSEEEKQIVERAKKNIEKPSNVSAVKRLSDDIIPPPEKEPQSFEPDCALPEIVEYHSDDTITYKLDNGFDARIAFEDFIDRFSPTVYCYSYFHAGGKRLIIFSQLTNKMIFPREFQLAKSQRISVPEPSRPRSIDSSHDVSVDSSHDVSVTDDPVSERSFLDDDTEKLRRHFQRELDTLADRFHQVL